MMIDLLIYEVQNHVLNIDRKITHSDTNSVNIYMKWGDPVMLPDPLARLILKQMLKILIIRSVRVGRQYLENEREK